MKERPILFSGAMIRAILDGTKTQTRRVMKPQPNTLAEYEFSPYIGHINLSLQSKQVVKCPYGTPGDGLWVRETFAYYPDVKHVIYREREGAELAAQGTDLSGCWKPSIFMPRWASRITLEVKAVRVERVQDITEDDAKAEGATPLEVPHLREAMEQGGLRYGAHKFGFSELWDSINAKRGFGWDANPWVWVVEFVRQKP